MKRPITAPNTHRSIRIDPRTGGRAVRIADLLNLGVLRAAALGTGCILSAQGVHAQQWQPSRISPTSQAQPLHPNTQGTSARSDAIWNDDRVRQQPVLPSHSMGIAQRVEHPQQPSQTHAGATPPASGVVLRWRSTGTSNAPQTSGVSPEPELSAGSTVHPIDRFQEIRPVHYQSSAEGSAPVQSGERLEDSVGSWRSDAPPKPESRNVSSVHWELPLLRTQQDTNPIENEIPRETRPGVDPLDGAESAPQPPIRDNLMLDPPSFPPQLGEDESPADRHQTEPSDSDAARDESLPNFPPAQPEASDNFGPPQGSDEELDSILRSAREASALNCVTQRERLRGHPLHSISLDVSPKLGDGLRSLKKQTPEEEQDLSGAIERRSLRRDWTDYRGDHLMNGRIVDLRFGNAIIETDGRRESIPTVDLSDADMTYIAELWNLPTRCGSGDEMYIGRQFIDSTVQWKASGACHNPLYFEQVELERYGHETGPILQPMISSAHFLLSIPVLPYKMAINPPHECQYTLGYYRPGNCAPYMMRPFPWSVRAGLVQAGAWVGASALIP